MRGLSSRSRMSHRLVRRFAQCSLFRHFILLTRVNAHFSCACDFSGKDIHKLRKMSHSVTITRTTVASSGTAVIVNTGYLSTLPGLLKVAQLLLGAACVGVVAYYVDHSSSNSRYVQIQKPELFFLLVATAFLIGTFCLVVSCLTSLSSATMMSRTVFEIVYHGLAFVMYLCAGLTLLIEVNHSKNSYGRDYEAYLAAAIMGLVLAGLYLISTFLANRHYRGF